MRKALRKLSFFAILAVLLVGLVGCKDAEQVKREVMPSLIEKVVNETQKAINQKDGKLARDIWSNVTEYSVKAEELGDQELAEALKKLATTYVKLIEYCDTGEENLLSIFNLDFAKALEKVKNVGTVVDKHRL